MNRSPRGLSRLRSFLRCGGVADFPAKPPSLPSPRSPTIPCHDLSRSGERSCSSTNQRSTTFTEDGEDRGTTQALKVVPRSLHYASGSRPAGGDRWCPLTIISVNAPTPTVAGPTLPVRLFSGSNGISPDGNYMYVALDQALDGNGA